MISMIQNNDVYEIRFRYDPTLVDMVKQVPGRLWHNESKMWTIPKNNLGFFLNQIKGTVYENICKIDSMEHINENADIETTTKIPNIDISRIPYYVKEGAKPYKHQLDFMKYAIDKQQRGYMSGFLIADDMGLGKTSESINLAIYNKKQYKFKHCLIICNINTSKYNWKNEVESATKGKMTGYILGARIKKDGTISYDGGSKPKIEDLRTEHMYGDKSCPKLPYFLICNVESLRAKEGRKYPFTDLLIDYINSRKINMVIIDEIHKNMSPTSTQGKQILRIKKATGHNCEWIPMTGTPIVRKPTDVFLPMKLIDAHNFSSYYTWNKEFCIYGGFGGHEIIGYKNIPRVKTMLQNNMIRRLKDQVLDLPPKIYFTEYVDNTIYQAKLYESVRQATLAEAGQILKLANPMVKLLKLRQVNGSPELVDPTLKVDKNYLKHNAKMQRMLQILEDIHEAGEKVIIFSNWVEPLRMVYKILIQKYKVCCFTGTMSDEAREKNKQVFQNNPEYTILVGTIGAAGTTHTFTAASNIIFLDEPFNATDKSQAEDRAYRIGTKQSLKIYTLLSRNTVDDRVHEIVYEKAATSKYIVDGVIDFRNNPDLFYKLLGK